MFVEHARAFHLAAALSARVTAAAEDAIPGPIRMRTVEVPQHRLARRARPLEGLHAQHTARVGLEMATTNQPFFAPFHSAM